MSLINKPTRYPDSNIGNPSLLDHIWTNLFNITLCGVIDYDIRDHRPNFCIYNYPTMVDKNEKIKVVTRPFSEANLKLLMDELEIID